MGADVSTAEAEPLIPVANEFAFNFFKVIANRQNGNIVFSPSAIAAGLSLMQLASKNETSQEINQVMGFEQFEKSDLHTAVGALRSLLFEKSKYWGFYGASRIYAPTKLKINKKFRKSSLELYQTVVEGKNFEDTRHAVRDVNHWLGEEMQHTANDMLTENHVDKTDLIVMINALYFAGKLETPFLSSSTKIGKFFSSETDSYNVAMMNVKCSFPYFYDTDMKCQVLEMPYHENKFRLLLVLPEERMGLSAIESSLTVQTLQKWCRPRQMDVVDVHLPRFDLDYTIDPSEGLKVMGISAIFNPEKADLSGIGDNAYLSKFFHYARVGVQEHGIIPGEDQLPGDVHSFVVSFETFKADHPFLFLIQDKRKGAIVFMGRQACPPKISDAELKEMYKRAKNKLKAQTRVS